MKRQLCTLVAMALIPVTVSAVGYGSSNGSNQPTAVAGATSSASTGNNTSSARTGNSLSAASIGDVTGAGSISTMVNTESRNIVWPGGIGGGNTTAPCQKGITAYLFHWTTDDDICYAAYLAQLGHAVNDRELMAIGTHLAHVKGREKLQGYSNGGNSFGLGFGVGIGGGNGAPTAATIPPTAPSPLPNKCEDVGEHCAPAWNKSLKHGARCERTARQKAGLL